MATGGLVLVGKVMRTRVGDCWRGRQAIWKRVRRDHECDGGLRGEMMMGVFVLFCR